MCIVFYTVNPEPERFPKAFIVRVFKDDEQETRCLKTVSFPVRNPVLPNKTLSEAEACGRMLVSQILNRELIRGS